MNAGATPAAHSPGHPFLLQPHWRWHTFTRAYLRHLIVAKEMLSATLLSIHNLYTLVHLAQDMRSSIQAGTFEQDFSHLLVS